VVFLVIPMVMDLGFHVKTGLKARDLRTEC